MPAPWGVGSSRFPSPLAKFDLLVSPRLQRIKMIIVGVDSASSAHPTNCNSG